MAEINLLALIVAAVVTLPIGYVWYGMIFSNAWMTATGMTEEKAKNSNPVVIYGLSLLFAFLWLECLNLL
jgi:Protein of unknown function (DUF1761)